MPSSSGPGRLVVLSGPSGVGKSTVVRRLLEICPLPLKLSVSATTRPPRRGERPGVDYLFLTADEFAAMRQNNQFLECAEVFGRGDWYGTPIEPVTRGLQLGKWIILEIDVTGAAQVARRHPDCVNVFIAPGSMEELERRLRGRGTEAEELVLARLQVARREMAMSKDYQFVVVNDDVDATAQNICGILTQLAEGRTCTKN